MKKTYDSILIACFIIIATGCSVQKKMIQTELYFGLSQNNGNIIADSVWNNFMQKEVTKVFSTGFTVIHSEGKWVDERYRQIHSEPSRIISSVGTMTPVLSLQIDSLREKYKSLFLQESVLRIDKKASINF
jgi:Protein of unknown function (DUF3574)